MPKSPKVRFTCAAHAPKPNPEYSKLPANMFIGAWVKSALIGQTEEGATFTEHMWFKILDTQGDMLVGRVNVTPYRIITTKRGDKVLIGRDKIEAADFPDQA